MKHYHFTADGKDKKWYNKIAEGLSVFSPFCGGNIVLGCKDIKDNIEDEFYYNVVKEGEVCNIVVNEHRAINGFVGTLCELVEKGKINKFLYKYIGRDILLGYNNEPFENEYKGHLIQMSKSNDIDFDVILNAFHIALETCQDIKLVIFDNLSVNASNTEDIKAISRQIEDFAETHKVAIIAFWNLWKDKDVYDYFCTHGHNVCYLNTYIHSKGTYFTFEYAGYITPKLQYYAYDIEHNKLRSDSDFNAFMLLRNILCYFVDWERTTDLKNKLIGYFGLSRKYSTISNYIASAKQKNILKLEQGQGKSNYKYRFNDKIDFFIPKELDDLEK